MRHRGLLAGVMILCPAMALAQEAAPRPFVVSQFSAMSSSKALGGEGFRVGFDATIGLRAWKGLQLIGQGGHLIDGVTPSVVRLQPLQFTRGNSDWYGAGGARYSFPAVWRLRAFGETSAGVAHVSSDVYAVSGIAPSLYSTFRSTVPLANVAAGVQLQLGRGFTIDGGYRAQHFFGDVDATHKHPYLALGVRF